MKLIIVVFAVLCLAVTVVPALAQQNLYDNGPVNGATDAWTINSGFIVSDSITCCKACCDSPAGAVTMTGFNFGVWEFPGDVMSSVDWSISTAPLNGGTIIGSGTASGKNLTDSFISSNQFGFDIDKITVTGLNVGLTGGSTYWLNLQNATVPSGDPVFWDENSGFGCRGDGQPGSCPSQAYESAVGTIPSEAFTINGIYNSGTTPEPSGILLFGSGILGVAGVLRRKLKF